MKTLRGLVVICILFLSSLAVIPVNAQGSVEEIRSFDSEVTVSSDATTKVREEITYNFPTARHGIIWRIPYVYEVKFFRRPTLIDINSVSYYPTSNPQNIVRGKYTESRTSGWLELQIGDANTTITGEYVYVIEYTMTYTGITRFDDHEEVYLNAIGPGWEVPIREASVTINTPGEVQDTVCYAGTADSAESNCSIEAEGSTVTLSITEQLDRYEGLTYAISFPVGTFENTTKQQIFEAILANIGILLPIPAGILLWGYIKRRGKNEKLTVIPSFTPEKDWNPLRSGFVYSMAKNNKYVSALLIDLAVNGYLTINQYGRNKYEVSKTEKSPDDLPEYIKTLYNGIFASGDTIQLSKLPNNFYLKVSLAFSELNNYLRGIGIFSKERESMRTKLLLFSILLGMGAMIGLGFFINNAALGWFLGLIVTALLLFISAFRVDLRSMEGNQEYHELLGLKLYINTAEKRRIEFHNNPEKFNRVFERLLPYAMIFGLERKWAKEFEDIYTQPPEWYQGDFTTFNAYYLSRSLGSFNTTVAAKSVAPRSYSSSGGHRSSGWSSGGSGFGGGGSVGGGGGGSGGGSW